MTKQLKVNLHFPTRNKKVYFILDHHLQRYRIPFFNELAKFTDMNITVIHSGPRIVKDSDDFNEINVSNYSLGPFFYRNISSVQDCDLLICMQNLRMLNLWLLSLNPFKNYKILHWGIGTSSSEGLSLKRTAVSQVRNFITRFCSALILYSDFPIPLFSANNKKKIFIAHNTVESPLSEDLSKEEKSHFLFIGTLNHRKGIIELIAAFNEYLKLPDIQIKKLVIVGEGEMRAQIEEYLIFSQLEENVILKGRIEDSTKKKELFREAICSISLFQAGLSVLESFSFGIPYLTMKDAISGGEHFNISNNHNGFLLNHPSDLVLLMQKLDSDRQFAQFLGGNAYAHYQSKRNIKDMVRSFKSSIVFASSTKD